MTGLLLRDSSEISKVTLKVASPALLSIFLKMKQKSSLFAKELLDEKFSEPLKNGQIDWQVVILDSPESSPLVDQFHPQSEQFVIGLRGDGVLTQWKILQPSLDLIEHKMDFQKWLKAEIKSFLNTV